MQAPGRKKQLFRSAPVLCILLLLTAGTLVVRGEELTLERMLANEKLREYFRDRLIEAHSARSFLGRRTYSGSLRHLEHRTDLLIHNFASEVADLLTRVQNALGEAGVHRIAVAGAEDSAEVQAAKLLWVESLEEVRDRTGQLHKKLRFPLSDLEAEADFAASFGPESRRRLYSREMSFLARELEEARGMLLAYLTQREQTVSVNSLREGNFLIRLDRVRKAADRLKDQIERLSEDQLISMSRVPGDRGEISTDSYSMPSSF